MEQIKLRVETIDWTEGEHGHFAITIRKGCTVEVDWGDGCHKTIVGIGDSQYVEHSYKNCLPIRSFIVSITSKQKDAIISYYHGFIDMWTYMVDVSACPGLIDLDASWTCEINLLGCLNLKTLTCTGDNMPAIDLKDCTNLEYLDISFNDKIKSINMTACNELHTLECRSCRNLKRISWSNRCKLRNIIADTDFMEQLMPKIRLQLALLLTKNGDR